MPWAERVRVPMSLMEAKWWMTRSTKYDAWAGDPRKSSSVTANAIPESTPSTSMGNADQGRSPEIE